MNDLLARLEKSKAFWFVLTTSVVFFLLRLPSLIEPYWYGDEGIYETIGLALTKGRLLYTQIWDNKPPLLYVTYALFHGNQEAVRMLSLLVGLGAVITLFFVARKLFASQKAVFIATAFFALFFGLPIIVGNIANAENFMLLLIILAAFLVFAAVSKKHTKPTTLILPGLLLGIAFLYKIVAVFDFTAFFIFLFLPYLPDKLTKHSLRASLRVALPFLGIFLGSFLLPFILSLLYFLIHGALSAYLQAIFFSNVDYVGYRNVFLIPQGLLFFKLLLLAVVLVFVYRRRASLSLPAIFLTLWLSFSLFNAFFSQRPYTHYQLVVLPSFSLLVGWLTLPHKKNIFPYIAALAIIVVIFSSFDHWSIKRTVSYYSNYLSFVTRNKTTRDYEAFFDSRVPRDMAIADYLRQQAKPDDQIFLWGNDAQIYALTGKLPPGKFTVAYHITANKTTLEQTQQALKSGKPRYIVLFSGVSTYPFALYNYRHKLSIEDTAIYERIY
jgi:4-amino-4-deoxy-L-arabinose transferase-like glycosyltransferase